jgi:hypothetical protein
LQKINNGQGTNIAVGMFPVKKHKPKTRSLANGLDSKILSYVQQLRKLDSSRPSKSLGVTELYDLLQQRDTQLRRIKKVQLEQSIQRALDILRAIDEDGDESFDSSFEGIEDLNLVEVKVPPSLPAPDPRRIRMNSTT